MQNSGDARVDRDESSFLDADGIRIHYTRWLPGPATAVIQLAHGVGEHAGRYEHVGHALAAAGYDVWADDHRGHGRTGLEQHNGNHERLGRLGAGGVPGAVRAVHDFTRHIRTAQPDLPLVLLGHSWGSLMAQILINQHAADYDAVVLTGTAHRTLRHMNSGNLNARYDHPGATGLEWLSRDPAVAQAFLDDPLTTATPLMKLFGPLDALRLLGRPARRIADQKDLPILIAVGSEDPLGGASSAEHLANDYRERSGLTSVTTLIYPGARHEVFNETNRSQVIADTITWLNNTLRKPYEDERIQAQRNEGGATSPARPARST